MDPPYNVHLTQNSVQCKPNTKIVHHSANRGSGVVFLIASGFLQQKTDVVMTKGATVNSLSINILCTRPTRPTPISLSLRPIEKGLKQKTRQNVVVLDWGSRSNATLGNFGVKV